MLLRHALDVAPGAPGGGRVHAAAYAPSGSRLAVAAGPERVTLYDGASHERRDKFATKPADAGPYAVTALAFSADSTRLAVAQSDGIVFVYKLGAAWGDKKSICNKFPAPAAATCVGWATGTRDGGGDGDLGAPPPLAELLFGCADGSVRVGALRSNKGGVTYTADGGSPALSLALIAGGRGVVSAHADGSVYAFQLRESAIEPDGQLATAALAAAATAAPPPGSSSWPLGTLRRLAQHASPVVAVACVAGGAVVAASADGAITVYDEAGGAVVAVLPPPHPSLHAKQAPPKTDYDAGDDDVEADSALSRSCRYHAAPAGPIAASPDGTAVVVATRAGLRLLSLQPPGGGGATPVWIESPPSLLPSVRHLGVVTALAWHPAGASVVVAGATGGVEVYETVLRHVAASAGVSVAFTSPTVALVSQPAAGVRLRLQCHSGQIFEGALPPPAAPWPLAAPPPPPSARSWRDGVLLRGKRYVALRTTASMMVVDLETGAATELPAGMSAAALAPGGGGAASVAAADSSSGSGSDVRVLCGLHPSVCGVYYGGVLTLGAYGASRPLGSVRCSSANRQAVSLVVHSAGDSHDGAVAGVTVACLRDPYTIATVMLADGGSSAPTTYAHSRRVAWLQLSDSGRHVLFRDARDGLYVLRVPSQQQSLAQYGCATTVTVAAQVPSPGAAMLLEPAAFAGWVPGTDVALAQRQRGEPLSVWYHLASAPTSIGGASTTAAFPGPVAHVDSRSGEAAAIRAIATDTGLAAEVLVAGAHTNGGVVAAGQTAVPLDTGLLSYYIALDGGDFARAAAILSAAAGSSSSPASDSSGLWAGLCQAALAGGDAVTASTAAVAVGDPALMRAVSRAAKGRDDVTAAAAARANRSTARSSEEAEAEAAAARLAALVGGHAPEPAHDAAAAWAAAAAEIVTLQRHGRWEDAAAAADAASKPDIGARIRQRALTLLAGDAGGDGSDPVAATGNESRAAALAEALGDAATAVRLHLAAGHAVRAAEVATQALSSQRLSAAMSAPPSSSLPRALLEDVVRALHRHRAHAAAGPLLDCLGRATEAVAAYVLGRAYRQAVELARRVAPDRVVALERAWGAALAAAGQHDAAVGHFIEAGDAERAIAAAIAGGQLARAAQLIQDTHGSVAGPRGGAISAAGRACWCKLAAAARKSGAVGDAEAFYLRCGDPVAAVTMNLTVPTAGGGGGAAAVGSAGGAPPTPTAAQLHAAVLHSPASPADAITCAAGASSNYALAAARAVADVWLSAEAAHDVFTAAAAAHARAGRHDVADAVLLAVGDIDGAMELQRLSGRWDALAALTAAQAPHRLQAVHAEAARALAAAGDAAGAERHFVDAGQWQAAAEAYQAQDRWDDARRVAGLGGGPDAANRVAIAQARALVAATGGSGGGGTTTGDLHAGITLLVDAGLVDAAVQFAIDARDWQLAVDTAEQHCSSEALPAALAAVAYRHGMALEDVGEFAAAEAEFLRAGRPREAIDMHVHVRDWAAARRVAAAHDPPAMTTIITAQAAAAASGGDAASAEALFVEAGRPDLAVDAYLAAASFSDALRVVRSHAPAQEATVAERIRRAMLGDAALAAGVDEAGSVPPGEQAAPAVAPAVGGATGLARARTLESQRVYSQAVDAYLALLPAPDGGVLDVGTSLSLAACEEAWLHAVRLAATHLLARLPGVADEVGERLAQLGPGKQAAAGDVYLSCAQVLASSASAGRYRARAVACYARGQAWERAYRAMTETTTGTPGQIVDDRTRDAVVVGYTRALVASGDVDSLLAMGPDGVEPALGVLAAHQRWERMFPVAAAAGPPQLARYLYPHLDDRLRHGDAGGAWALLRRYGAPAHVGTEAVATLTRLTHALFADRTLVGDAQQPAGARADELSGARDVLVALVGQLRDDGGGGGSAADPALVTALDRLAWAVHLSAVGVRYAYAGAALADQAATAAVSRLRYADVLPPDQLLYVAAAACRAAPGRVGEARALMNRYLDVADAIDAAAAAAVTVASSSAAAGSTGWADFGALLEDDHHLAGVLPPPGRLAATQAGAHYVADAAARRAAREWVVRASLDPAAVAAAGSVPGAPCPRCGVHLPWTAAACNACGAGFPCCVASGRPLQRDEGAACVACGGVADPAAAAAVAAAFGECAWCGAVVTAARP